VGLREGETKRLRRNGIIIFFVMLCCNTVCANDPFRVATESDSINGAGFFFTSSFRPEKVLKINKVRINFGDAIPDDTLTIYYPEQDLPEAYSRNFYTAVCMDTACRLVNITLFWEVTGKYLGYWLPAGTALTKREHTPFTERDYTRLNEILSDSSSLLRSFTPQDIHPINKTGMAPDGTTGATLPDVMSWIVPEAAYTSYSLWHLTYGATRDSINAYTKKHLFSNRLLVKMLQNGDPFSQIKAFQWIGKTDLNNLQFIEPAFKILHSQNYKSANQALKFLKKSGINEARLQTELILLLDNQDFRIKYVAIEYLRESAEITQPVAEQLMKRLDPDNYFMVNVILSLLGKKYQPNHGEQLQLSKLLSSKNINVSNRAFHFLIDLPNQSPDLARQLNRYRKRIL
jgi:hypothetical protein